MNYFYYNYTKGFSFVPQIIFQWYCELFFSVGDTPIPRVFVPKVSMCSTGRRLEVQDCQGDCSLGHTCHTGRNNVFPYFVNSTETRSCLYPSSFRHAETWWSSFPWTRRVSVVSPRRKRMIMFPSHFCWVQISVLSCFRYVLGDVFFLFF